MLLNYFIKLDEIMLLIKVKKIPYMVEVSRQGDQDGPSLPF